MLQAEPKKCAAFTKLEKHCGRDALEGQEYCKRHRGYGGGGGNAPRPDGGDKGSGGAAKALRTTADGVRIADFLARVWDWIQENADIFFSTKQIALYGQLVKQRNEAKRRKLFAQLLSGLSAEQWARLLTAVGIGLAVRAGKRKQRTKLTQSQ